MITSRIYANPRLLCTILERDTMSNCVKNVRVQALCDSVILSRRLMQKILNLLNCDSTILKIRATKQSLNDRNKIANERQVNNCDLRTDQDMCTFFIM